MQTGIPFLSSSTSKVMSAGVYLEDLHHVPLRDTSLKLHTNTGESVKPGVLTCDCGLQGTVKGAPNVCDEKQGTYPFWQRMLESIQLHWPFLRKSAAFWNNETNH